MFSNHDFVSTLFPPFENQKVGSSMVCAILSERVRQIMMYELDRSHTRDNDHKRPKLLSVRQDTPCVWLGRQTYCLPSCYAYYLAQKTMPDD